MDVLLSQYGSIIFFLVVGKIIGSLWQRKTSLDIEKQKVNSYLEQRRLLEAERTLREEERRKATAEAISSLKATKSHVQGSPVVQGGPVVKRAAFCAMPQPASELVFHSEEEEEDVDVDH